MSDVLAAFFHTDLFTQYGGRIFDGVRMTLLVTGISYSLGFLLSYPVAMARRSKNPVIAGLALVYVTLFRGTPLLVQLYLCYYGAGQIRPFLQSVGLWVFFRDAFFCCLLAFTLNTAAYQSEIVRGAFSALGSGQREAAQALGLSRWHTFRHVIWPQAFLIMLRPLCNELIAIVKASALSAIVTLLDLMGQTRFVFARTFDFTIYLYAAVIYLVMTEALRRLSLLLERRFSRHIPRMALAKAETAGGRGVPTLTPIPSDGLSAH